MPCLWLPLKFQSTLPMRGATIFSQPKNVDAKISIHTPHAGSDWGFLCTYDNHEEFQSTLPMRGATDTQIKPWNEYKNFNPHSPCGERRYFGYSTVLLIYFNPHSPCGERLYPYPLPRLPVLISIHTPHAGSDRPPTRLFPRLRNFNPHSPCGERPPCVHPITAFLVISIHTPHAGSDENGNTYVSFGKVFQSTLPMRGATLFAA